MDLGALRISVCRDLPATLTSTDRRNLRGPLNGGGHGDFRFNTFSGSVQIAR